ncbi:MAG TPA: hypothetical protein PKD20_00785 [Candidatus Saccharibacteria bacterium]|jgi:hypothetical protein|nr:hypothetical protein [Candidatus Saccharibacteria bacterium]HMT55392.1 hypothetical protein [Candidatus Saccharibacteria bacterium]
MSYEVAPNYERILPPELSGGRIFEEEYVPTPGTTHVVSFLLGVPNTLSDATMNRNGVKGLLSRNLGDDLYMQAIADDEAGSRLLRAFDTDILVSERYDFTEALRLTDSLTNFILSKKDVGAALNSKETEFIERRNGIALVASKLDEELRRDYRKNPVVGVRKDETGYSICSSEPWSDDTLHIAERVDEINAHALIGAARGIITESVAVNLGARRTVDVSTDGLDREAILRAIDFRDGITNRANMSDILALAAAELRDGLSVIETSSEVGALCVRVASGAIRQQEAWRGSQTVLELPWYSIVSSGGMDQS